MLQRMGPAAEWRSTAWVTGGGPAAVASAAPALAAATCSATTTPQQGPRQVPTQPCSLAYLCPAGRHLAAAPCCERCSLCHCGSMRLRVCGGRVRCGSVRVPPARRHVRPHLFCATSPAAKAAAATRSVRPREGALRQRPSLHCRLNAGERGGGRACGGRKRPPAWRVRLLCHPLQHRLPQVLDPTVGPSLHPLRPHPPVYLHIKSCRYLRYVGRTCLTTLRNNMPGIRHEDRPNQGRTCESMQV